VDAVKASAKGFEILRDADEEREHDSADGGIIAKSERFNAT